MENKDFATYYDLAKLEQEIDRLKKELEEVRVSNKEEITKIHNRIKELEDQYIEIKVILAELRNDVRHVGVTQDDLVQEIKLVSTQITRLNTINEQEEKEDGKQTNLIETLLSNNNRITLIVIFTICSALLFTIGMKFEDILSLFAL